jgi:hypothetical protein
MSTPRQREEGESDESFNAMMAKLYEFNRKMYGDGRDKPKPPLPPTMEPMTPKPKVGSMDLKKRIADNAVKVSDLKQRVADIKNKIPVTPKNVTPKPPKNVTPVKPMTPTRPTPDMPVGPKFEDRVRPDTPTPIYVASPLKKAAGGAAKVRKGMMSPEGKILHAMNKIRGK